MLGEYGGTMLPIVHLMLGVMESLEKKQDEEVEFSISLDLNNVLGVSFLEVIKTVILV